MKRYFIFGSVPTEQYSERMEVKDIELPMDGVTYVFDPLEQDIQDLLSSYDGWNGYWEITEEEYNYLENMEQ